MISIDPATYLHELLAREISAESIGTDSVEISLPFVFDDGDQLSFFANRQGDGRWLLTDDGEVLLKAEAQGLDLSQPVQAERLQSLVEFYGARTDRGAIHLETSSTSLGDDIYAFAQTCLEASWLSKMNRLLRSESTKAQFNEKLAAILSRTIAEERIERRWFDETSDPDRLYPVDYRVECKGKQLFLFGVSSMVHCTEATISCLHHRNVGTEFIGVVVYEEETNIRKKHADRLNDVADKRFARIGEEKSIGAFLAAA